MAENFFGITDTGRLRTNNEDTFIAETVMGGRFIAACVIDGVGGYTGGEVAARLAHDAILEHVENGSGEVVGMLKEALSAANEAIYREKQVSKQNDQMACVLTLALVDVAGNKFYYAHVGDTRLYLLRDHSLVKVTRDHSFVGFLEDSGRLSEEAAMKHPKRNEINKALGFDSQIRAQDYIETGESPFLPGDTIMLCSDGLTDLVPNKTMTEILTGNKGLAIKAKALVRAANDAGGKDNITVVLVRNSKTPLKQQATKPSAVSEKKNDTIIADKTVSEPVNNTSVKPLTNAKKKSSAVPILSFLLILVVAALAWLVYRDYANKKMRAEEVKNNIVVKERSQEEQALVDSITGGVTKEVFVLNTAGDPAITVTDSILVNRDTLHIICNGVTLISDTAYKGPALTVSENCRYILLDSLVLENFDVGVLAKNRSLHLKNVQFKNCRVPVQYDFRQSNQPMVNGRYADTIYTENDSSQNNY